MWKCILLLSVLVLPLYGQTLDQAPRFHAESLDGEAVSLDSLLENGPVFVSFWALWCKPCIRELDDLKAIWEEHHERGFEIVAISQDGPRSVSRVKPMVRSKGWDYTVLLDPDKELSRAFQVIALPTSFLIDTDGKVVRAQQGYKPGMEETLEKEIRELLGPLEKETEEREEAEEEKEQVPPVDAEEGENEKTEETIESQPEESPAVPQEGGCGRTKVEEGQNKTE